MNFFDLDSTRSGRSGVYCMEGMLMLADGSSRSKQAKPLSPGACLPSSDRRSNRSVNDIILLTHVFHAISFSVFKWSFDIGDPLCAAYPENAVNDGNNHATSEL